MTLLEVRGLTYAHNTGKDCLSDVSFTCDRGEFVVIAGPSGCGKSTLLRCINGIYPHAGGGAVGGDVLVDGRSVLADPPEARSACMGTVFQDFEAQIIHMSVEDELAFGPENTGMPRADITRSIGQILRVIVLEPEADTFTLSGGQKQRLCLGGTLACGQDILLLDEPLSNMDSDSARRLIEFLLRIKENGKAIVMVEHRLDLVTGYADRVLWMENSRLSASAPDMPAICRNVPARRKENPEEAVRIRDLSFAYGKGKPVLSDVNAKIATGDMAVVLGRNGSGKSTLLQLLAGLLPVRQGSVELFGEQAREKPARFFRRRVGLVTQNPNHQLFMDSVYNEVYLNCMDRARCEQALEVFGLQGLRDRHPFSLSEGEKRRTALAAVVAAGPGLLLLDEPTLGQDRASLIRMIDALRDYNEKTRLTVITVTHDEAASRAFGDRAFVLAGGTMTEMEGDGAIDSYFSESPLNRL